MTRIAFYAPMKPPASPVPSGDRQMARQIVAALELAGHEVGVASEFVSRDGDGGRQRRLKALGGRMADRLIRRMTARPPRERPDVWFTYHVYHKAPDWLGPAVSAALNIPYVICEASFAPKQEGGPWALSHEAARNAIQRANAVIGLNTADLPCVLALMEQPGRLRQLKPFIDVAPFSDAANGRDAHRAALAATYELDPQTPVLLAVGMMRPGDKLESYRLLGRALASLRDEPWQLVVVGDGPVRDRVRCALAPLGPDRVRYAGVLAHAELAAFYAGSDILVWPAIREAYGVALLEAQAAGLPVVAGDSGGVPDILRNGETGLVVPMGDAPAFAEAVRSLLHAPYNVTAHGAAARRIAARDHSLEAAARKLDEIVSSVCAEPVQ